IGQSEIGAANRFEIPDVVRCADDRGEGAMTLRRRPEIDDSNPVRLRGDELEVLFDAFSGYELSIGAHSKAELILGRRDLRPQWQGPTSTYGERDGADPRELHASDDIKGLTANLKVPTTTGFSD